MFSGAAAAGYGLVETSRAVGSNPHLSGKGVEHDGLVEGIDPEFILGCEHCGIRVKPIEITLQQLTKPGSLGIVSNERDDGEAVHHRVERLL